MHSSHVLFLLRSPIRHQATVRVPRLARITPMSHQENGALYSHRRAQGTVAPVAPANPRQSPVTIPVQPLVNVGVSSPAPLSVRPPPPPVLDPHHDGITDADLGLTRSNETFLAQDWYCSINDKHISAAGEEAALLRKLGFGADKELHLKVGNTILINDTALRIRLAKTDAQRREIMHSWPRWLQNSLGKLALNERVQNVAVALQELLDQKLERNRRRRAARNIQNVVDDAPTVSSSASSSEGMIGEAVVDLNSEQQKALQLAEAGHNLYVGGCAGTGKTVLIRSIVRRLQEKGLRVAVTATTGIAGCHIGGCTFHHALGVTIYHEFVRPEELLAYNVVIIDEISMMPKALFDEFDRRARNETGCTDLPFGGIQVIACGDFLQLSAVNEVSVMHSSIFQQFFVKCKLVKQVRQSEHPFFAEQLAIMRKGAVPSKLIQSLKQLPAGTMEPNAINLLPTNRDVAIANEAELNRLPGDPIPFQPLPQPPSISKPVSPSILMRVVHGLPLNVMQLQQQVVEHMKIEVGWPNNAYVSVVKEFADAYTLRLVYPDGMDQPYYDASNHAFLKLAPRISAMQPAAIVHEVYEDPTGRHPPEVDDSLREMLESHPVAKRMSLKIGCRVLLRSNLTTGLVNGTIGTVTGFAACHVDNIPRFLRDETVDMNVGKYYQFLKYECLQETPMLPVVKFHSGEEVVVPPVDFTAGGHVATSHYSIRAVALPLTLAYAFTVHKVQGLTLVGKVHLELSKMWPCNHLLYVAMSRVKNPDQLSVSGFQDFMVVADPEAVAFDSNLPTVDQPWFPQHAPATLWKALRDAHGSGTPVDLVAATSGLESIHTNVESMRAPFTDDSARQRRLNRVVKLAERMSKKLHSISPKKPRIPLIPSLAQSNEIA